MEQNDMLSTWKELNNRLNESELVNKKTLITILERKRRSTLSNMLRIDKIAVLGFTAITIIVGYILFSKGNSLIVIDAMAIFLLVTAILFNVTSYNILRKVDFDSPISLIYKRVISYKRVTNLGYFVIYIFVIILITVHLILVPTPFIFRVILALLIPICVAIDYLIYHSTSTKLKELIEISKELKEMKQEE